MNLIQHLEHYLGEISYGWKDSGSNSSPTVAAFYNHPFDDINTYVTVGMSDLVLQMGNHRTIRQELVFFAYRNFEGKKVASFLSTFAESIISSNRALLRGDVVGPSGPIILGSLLNSVFSAIPMILPDSFSVFEDSVPKTVFSWVIPIHEEEANYIRANGWSNFEVLLERKNPELWDLHRTSIV